MRKPLIGVILLVAFIKLLGSIGEQDHQQELAEERDYCWRVQSGVIRHWNTDITCPSGVVAINQQQR